MTIANESRGCDDPVGRNSMIVGIWRDSLLFRAVVSLIDGLSSGDVWILSSYSLFLML